MSHANLNKYIPVKLIFLILHYSLLKLNKWAFLLFSTYISSDTFCGSNRCSDMVRADNIEKATIRIHA